MTAIEKEKFREKIKEVEREFYRKDPCRNCGPGNGCDDCRGCKDGEISHQMHLEVEKLKDEYNKIFNTDYRKEEDERFEQMVQNSNKKRCLEAVWKSCSVDEIIKYGKENNLMGDNVLLTIDEVCEYIRIPFRNIFGHSAAEDMLNKLRESIINNEQRKNN